jgi:hypothetical protein
MSVARLLVSGVMVASGLLLGAFTLHGYLDPQWQQRQMQAARVTEPWAASTRPVAGGALVTGTPASPRPTPAKAAAKPAAPGPEQAEAQAAAAKARKLLAEKKRAEKKKADEAAKAEKAKGQQAQQTTLWDWLTSAN